MLFAVSCDIIYEINPTGEKFETIRQLVYPKLCDVPAEIGKLSNLIYKIHGKSTVQCSHP